MDHSLRARLRAGDPDAFGEIFDDHAQALHRHAVYVTGDPASAEDVVSLVFLEAWRLRHKLDADRDQEVLPWLYGIATNVLRNTTRATRRHRQAMARVPAQQPVPDIADELVGRITDAQRLTAVRSALGRLRRPEREVFTLCVWSGLDYAAAAAALGVPVGTVRSRLSRARTRLRALVAEELRPAPTRWEPPGAGGQVPGDRTLALRATQERNR